MTDIPVPELLTLAEVAQLTRFHPSTIRRFVETAGFPVFRVRVPGTSRASLRFDRASVLAWLHSHGQESDAGADALEVAR